MYILKKATKHSNKRISSFITSNSENQKKKREKKEKGEPLTNFKASNTIGKRLSKLPNTSYFVINNSTFRYC